jgi:pimeloyl-ACP methyl ester carboxylesterase
LVFIVLGVVLILVISFCCYWVAFYNPERRHGEPVPMPKSWRSQKEGPKLRKLFEQMSALPFERVEIRSRDGLRLVGSYYHRNDGAMLHIQFHGYRGSGARDLCGLHHLAMKMGHNILVVNQRASGASEGSTITFGIKERFDCVEWANYAARRFGKGVPIVLAGVSMGAATVLMASELELPENVIGVIADCGYSSPGAIIRKVSRDVHIPGWLSYPFIMLGALIFGRFRLWQRGAIDAVRGAKVPILLIHGENDRYVPCEMSRDMKNAAGQKAVLETFPGAAHGISYVTDPQRYERIVSDFLNRCRKQ